MNPGIDAQPDLLCRDLARLRERMTASEERVRAGLIETLEIGTELLRLRAGVEHGRWTAALSETWGGSARTARRAMQLAGHRELLEPKIASGDIGSIAAALRELAPPAEELAALPEVVARPFSAGEPASDREPERDPADQEPSPFRDEAGEAVTTFSVGEIAAGEPEDAGEPFAALAADGEPNPTEGAETEAPAAASTPAAQADSEPAAAALPPELIEMNERLRDAINRLHALRRQVAEIVDGTKAGAWIHRPAIEADFHKLTSSLRQGLAVRLCPHCKGVGCNRCAGSGYLNPQFGRQDRKVAE